MGVALIIFTRVRKSTGRSVVAIADDHVVADDQRAHFFSGAMRQLCPFYSHFHVGAIVAFLFSHEMY